MLGKVDTLVFDKTGTLTEGKPTLVSIRFVPPWSDAEVLRLAASLERRSEHPVASAVIAGAEQRAATPGAVKEFRSVTGYGVTGVVDGHSVAVGTSTLLRERLNIADPGLAVLEEEAARLRAEGQTTVFVAVDGKAAGLLGVADPVKSTTLRPSGYSENRAFGWSWSRAITSLRRRPSPGRSGSPNCMRGCSRRKKAPSSQTSSHKAVWSRWRAMASMMRRRWLLPTWGLRWEPERTLPWKARA